MDSKNSGGNSKARKWPIIIGVVVGIIIILALVMYFSVFKTNTPIATLKILSGNVQVDSGSGWFSGTDGMNLKQSYSVKTSDDGRARIIMLDSVIVTMENDTELNLKDVNSEGSTVSQKSGTVWNKFIKASGVNTYSVDTPTTVATVRGTMFRSKMFPNKVGLLVAEGLVGFSNDNNSTNVSRGRKMIADNNGTMYEANITSEDIADMMGTMTEDLQAMKDLRIEMLRRNNALYGEMKKQYNIDDNGVIDLLDKIDKGLVNDSEIIDKSPVKVPLFKELKAIDDSIKEQQNSINELNAIYNIKG